MNFAVKRLTGEGLKPLLLQIVARFPGCTPAPGVPVYLPWKLPSVLLDAHAAAPAPVPFPDFAPSPPVKLPRPPV